MTRAPGPIRFRRGITIAEAAIATVIVAGVLVAGMNSVAASRTVRGWVADRVRAQQLALDLMSEILQQGFANPGTTASSRAAWAYVDDYNGLIDSPPQTKSGTPIPDAAPWSRNVSLQWADPLTFAPSNATNTGIRLITVTVNRGTLVLATVNAYRTSGWVNGASQSASSSPIASATAWPLTGAGGNVSVSFSAAGSTTPSGKTLSYAWNFGDGFSGIGATISHEYAAIGSYTATLTVSDGQGGVGISCVTITVTK